MTITYFPGMYGTELLQEHGLILAKRAISPEVAMARGYKSITEKDDLKKLGFAPPQRQVPGLLIPIRDVTGVVVTHQYRPDQPRHDTKGRAIKYELPRGSRVVIDVPAAVLPALGDPKRPLGVTEGALKADAGVSAGLDIISISGVYGWRGTNKQRGKLALADWEAIAFNGRTFRLIFDSDVMTNDKVREALRRLKAFLESRDAHVQIVSLPHGADGSKVGVDDYLAAGHSVADLLKLTNSDLPGGGRDMGAGQPRSQASQLISMALDTGLELFHTPNNEVFARTRVNNHHENLPIRSKAFKWWLAALFFKETDRAVGTTAMQEALETLAAKAQFDGEEHLVFVRVAGHKGAIYVDLANKGWQAIRVTSAGWDLVEDPPMRFRRPRGLLALPTPVHGGRFDKLKPFVNVSKDEGWLLLASFIVGALRPEGPYPVLVLVGEQGTAKSTTARLIASIIDRRIATLRSEPRSVQDLMIAANNSWLLCFDNLSYIPSWLSDALCRLSTGGGFGTRELYSDAEETLLDAMRPVVVTSIEDIVTRPDLLSRSIVLPLSPISEDQRRSERELWDEFEKALPDILGGLLDAVSHAIRALPGTRLEGLPRMADFATWAVAAEAGLGLEPGSFIKAYKANITEGNELALEADPVASKLLQFMGNTGAESTWKGTATRLLTLLTKLAGEDLSQQSAWPKRADKLSNRLRRLAPSLRALGVNIEFSKGHSRGRQLTITRAAQGSVPGDSSDPPPPDDGGPYGAWDAKGGAEDATDFEQDASTTQADADLDWEDAWDTWDATLPQPESRVATHDSDAPPAGWALGRGISSGSGAPTAVGSVTLEKVAHARAMVEAGRLVDVPPLASNIEVMLFMIEDWGVDDWPDTEMVDGVFLLCSHVDLMGDPDTIIRQFRARKVQGTPCGDAEDDSSSSNYASRHSPFLVGHTPGANVVVLTTASDVERFLPKLQSSVIGLDCETTGLDPLVDRPRLIQLATPDQVYILDCLRVNPQVLNPLFNEGGLIVGHNLKFDLQFLHKAGLQIPVGARLFDTMLAAQLLGAGTVNGHLQHCKLDALAKRFLRVDLDKRLQASSWDGPLSDEQLAYAARDAAILLPLHERLRQELVGASLRRSFAIEMRALPAIAAMELQGVPLDSAGWEELSATAAEQVSQLGCALDNLAGEEHSVNWQSPKQVLELLHLLGHSVSDTSEATLTRLSTSEPIAPLLLRYRQAKGRAQTFGPGYLEFVHSATGRIHAEYLQLGAASGRMACHRPNLQQVPREPVYRQCFRAREGRMLVKADYAQIELRIAAELTGDRRMVEAFERGDDLHAVTAATVLGRPVENIAPDDRQMAKALNFGLLYGMGAERFQQYAAASYGVKLTLQKAQQMRGRFFSVYPGLRRWHRNQREDVVETRTLAGRRRLQVVKFTEKLNSPVQGTGADVIKLALALLWETRNRCPNAYPVLTVHDEIVVECPAADVEAVRTWLTDCMTAAAGELLKRVPVAVSVSVGPSWDGGK